MQSVIKNKHTSRILSSSVSIQFIEHSLLDCCPTLLKKSIHSSCPQIWQNYKIEQLYHLDLRLLKTHTSLVFDWTQHDTQIELVNIWIGNEFYVLSGI